MLMPRPSPRRRRPPCAADIVLWIAIAAAVPLSQRALAQAGGRGGDRLVLQSGAAIVTVRLQRDSTYTLPGDLGPTRVRVAGGAAWIDSASCRDRLCVRMGRLRGPGRALVCLPNRVVVQVRGPAASAGVDAVAR
jgi:hypothetical protein